MTSSRMKPQMNSQLVQHKIFKAPVATATGNCAYYLFCVNIANVLRMSVESLIVLVVCMCKMAGFDIIVPMLPDNTFQQHFRIICRRGTFELLLSTIGCGCRQPFFKSILIAQFFSIAM